jgi:hypothetical protein
MKKNYFYRYMGTNGILETPVYLEGIYCLKLVQLTADKGNVLTNGEKITNSISVPESEASAWIEIENPQPEDDKGNLK